MTLDAAKLAQLHQAANRTLSDASQIELKYAAHWLVEAAKLARWFVAAEPEDGFQPPDEAYLVSLGGVRWNAFPGEPESDPRVVAFNGLFQFIPPNRSAKTDWLFGIAAGKGQGLALLCNVPTRRQAKLLIEAIGLQPEKPHADAV
jgi:hypothetical protein